MSCHRLIFIIRAYLVLLIASITMVVCNTLQSSTIPPPPPISLPVYSLSVPYLPHGQGGVKTSTSMNIVTYATAASVAPPKLWTVSLYTNTLTHHAFFYGSDTPQSITHIPKPRFGVLQLLSKHQVDLVHILGKHSALSTRIHDQNYNKQVECMKVGYPWAMASLNESVSFQKHTTIQQHVDTVDVFHVLPKCQAYLLLAFAGQSIHAGDHDVALCEVVDTGVWIETISDSSNSDTSMDGVHEDSCRQIGDIQWASSQACDEINPWNGSSPKDETTVLYTGYLRSIGLL